MRTNANILANYLNAQDVLLPPIPDLSRRLKIRLQEAQALVSAISRAIAPRTSLVSTLVSGEGSGSGNGLGKRKRRNGREGNDADLIRTGDEALDGLLGGGVRTGCITEIVGERSAALISRWIEHELTEIVQLVNPT
jgi:hypothetical protein